MHIFTLEKFWPTSALILTWPNFSLDLPLSPCKGVFPISPDFLSKRLRKLGTFHFLLVILSQFSISTSTGPTLDHWLASLVSSTSKTHILCLPTTPQVSPVWFSWNSVALNFGPKWDHGPSLKHCGPLENAQTTLELGFHVKVYIAKFPQRLHSLDKFLYLTQHIPYKWQSLDEPDMTRRFKVSSLSCSFSHSYSMLSSLLGGLNEDDLWLYCLQDL